MDHAAPETNPEPSADSPTGPDSATPPLSARIMCHALLAGLFALWLLRGNHEALWLPLLLGLTSIGVARQVAWGRFLFSVVSLFVALCIFMWFCAPPDEFGPDERPPFDQWLGFMAPYWLSWILIVAGAVVALTPALLIGWRKHWFRSAWW